MIELQDVCVAYRDGVTALNHVSLRIDQGEFVFVVGPTGAGKSTFLKLLYREEAPSSGRVIAMNEDVSKIRHRAIPAYRRRLGVVFQDFGLLPNRTAYENVAFALRVIEAPRSEIRRRVPEVLEMVGLAHRPDALPHQLSGGEQQRIAIARALVNQPRLLIADEPTGNLDPETSHGIMELLLHINATGTTVLVATHDTAIVDRLEKRVIAFMRGKVIRDELAASYHQAVIVVREASTCG